MEQVYFGLLNAIQQEIYTTKSNQLPTELIQQIALVSNQIMDRRKALKEDNKKKRDIAPTFYQNISPEKISSDNLTTPKLSLPESKKRIKPSYIRLMNEVFSPDCLNEVTLS